MNISLKTVAVAAMLSTAGFAGAAFAGSHIMTNIFEGAVASEAHTTLVAAVQAAGLVETLSGDGPFTVFAPVNAAFEALPAGTVDTLLMEENKPTLTTILTCHVVGAKAMAEAVVGLISDGGGSAMIETLGGCMLTASLDGDNVIITDENGTAATVVAADLEQTNGVIHAIDAVIQPAM